MNILFADTGAGKSALAVQIVESIARGRAISGFTMEATPQKALYFDFELTEMQLQPRYAILRGDGGRLWYEDHYKFSENFRRYEINGASRIFDQVVDWERTLISEIEQTIIASNAKVVVVDNITWLARETDKGKFALPLMQRLNDLKKQHGLYIKVLAHIPERDDSRPISINDLAGSKILANFADSIYAIGKSHRDVNLRYLKQLKARSTEISYATENVVVLRLEKTDNFLGFEPIGRAAEFEHLKALSEDDKAEQRAQIKDLARQGLSYREIARNVGVSKSKVERLLKEVSHLSYAGTAGTDGTVETANLQIDYPPDLNPDEFDRRCAEVAQNRQVSLREAARIVIDEHKAAAAM